MILKYIKLLFACFLLIVLASCVSKQKKASALLGSKIEDFKSYNKTTVEFLSYFNISKDYSYIVDTPLLVKKIIYPNIAIMGIGKSDIAVEFTDKEADYSFSMLNEGAYVLFQEGILLADGKYTDNKTKHTYKKLIICRSNECRELSFLALNYMKDFKKIDPVVPVDYNADELYKYLTNTEQSDEITQIEKKASN